MHLHLAHLHLALTPKQHLSPPDKDGRQGRPLKVQQALREGCSRGLHPSLITGIDLQIVAVRAVQAQQAVAMRPILWVHHCTKELAQVLRLRDNAWNMTCSVAAKQTNQWDRKAALRPEMGHDSLPVWVSTLSSLNATERDSEHF